MTTHATNSDALPPGDWLPAGPIVRYRPTDPLDCLRPMFCGTERGYQWHRHNDRSNWPLPADDPCGCRAAHRAHYMFRERMARRAQREEAS